MGIEKKSFSGAKSGKKTAAGKARTGTKVRAPSGRKLTNLKVSLAPMFITKKIDKSTPF